MTQELAIDGEERVFNRASSPKVSARRPSDHLPLSPLYVGASRGEGMSIGKKQRISGGPSRVMALNRHHHPQRQPPSKPVEQRHREPAASVELSWQCPTCGATCQQHPNASPTCPMSVRYPDEHAQIAELRARAHAQRHNRAIAGMLRREADQHARHLLQRTHDCTGLVASSRSES